MALVENMLYKFKKNERKACPHMKKGDVRTWEDCDTEWLITRIEDEIVELREELANGVVHVRRTSFIFHSVIWQWRAQFRAMGRRQSAACPGTMNPRSCYWDFCI